MLLYLKATDDLLDGYLKKVHEMPIEDLEVAEQDCAIVATNSTKLLKQVLSIWDFIERRENIVLNGRFSLFPCCQRTNETINKIYLEKAKLVSRVALIALKRIEVLWQVTRWKFKKENLVDIQYVLT
ncbi:MAG: hypothetical protein EB051_04940, partial [Chlamydiia bacterium]|nr:hypothetical protein [Chlamydiia bacterium]